MSKFSYEKPDITSKQITELISQISVDSNFTVNLQYQQVPIKEIISPFYQQEIIKNWDGNMLKCQHSINWQDSQEGLQIKTITNEIIINCKVNNFNGNQCYLTKVLQPKTKIYLQTSTQQFNQKRSFCLFGLIEEANKDSKGLHLLNNIYYSEMYGGTTRSIIRGTRLSSNSVTSIGQKIYEFRIHIENQTWKISTYPDYQNVVELNDKSKINPAQTYYFAILVCWKLDQVIIQEVLEVYDYDQSM